MGQPVFLQQYNFSMPSVIKYTPKGKSILWGRTEYSAAFDSIDSVALAGQRTTQFSDRVTFAANAVLKDGEKLDIAIQPAATFFLRGESGARLGATAIVRYDAGRNSMGATLTWTVATAPSPQTPPELGISAEASAVGWLLPAPGDTSLRT